MYRIVYVSTAAMLSDAVLDQILIVASENNRHTGITGFLLYNSRNFLQLIEGEEPAVRNLIARIEADPRHNGVARLFDGEVVERCTPDWSMQQVVLAQDPALRVESLRDVLPVLDDWTARLVGNFAHLN